MHSVAQLGSAGLQDIGLIIFGNSQRYSITPSAQMSVAGTSRPSAGNLKIDHQPKPCLSYLHKLA
jgi:hypothetical protein